MQIDTSRFRVKPGRTVRLKQLDPGDTMPFGSNRDAAAGQMEKDVERLFRLQELLYAENRWAVLLVFQAMDAGGKDSAIKHVMRGLNPQGTRVASFKAPSNDELAHDYLWRVVGELPARGMIGVFNRSHYEEVLIARVHPEIIERQRLPEPLVTRDLWKERYQDINGFERHVARNGTVICKFFLHVSKEEQRRRFLDRLDDPAKNWKFSLADAEERNFWRDYMGAYQDMLSATSTRHAPWHVVPADHKWFAHLVIARIIIEALESLGLEFPTPSASQRKELAKARRQLRETKH
jgi:PPK2 family polyphosphate:nucleotide phosphotransferase